MKVATVKRRAGFSGGLSALVAAMCCSGAARADAIVVQCTVDKYRTSLTSSLESFMIQVDSEAHTITTYYGTTPLKITRRELRGAAGVSGGWQTSVTVDRNSGKLEASLDKVEGGKYSYAFLQGKCILPKELQGSKYKSVAGP